VPFRTGGVNRELKRWERCAFGALAGVVAAAAGLAVAELTTTASDRLQSPVLDVGDRVVDGVPNSIKTLAIDWFGTNDKVALLTGIGAVLTLYAVVLGVVALTRFWRLAIAGAAAFGLIGAYASQTSRRAAPWWAVAPSIAGGLVAALVLVALRRVLLGRPASVQTARDEHEHPAPDRAGHPIDRRRFLLATGATAAGTLVIGTTGHALATRSDVAAQRSALQLPRPRRALPPVAPETSAGVTGVSPFVTSNADFYRIDTALTVPRVSIGSWRLSVTGMVAHPLELTYRDLTSREIVEADVTLACVSNEVGGGLIGNARWLGVRLDDVLDEAGIDLAANQIVGRSVDGFTCGFPVAALDGRHALIAIGMNGEPLPLAHGYPARLIVPGLYGYVSATKWLREIELTTFDAFDQYWVRRGWVDNAPIKIQSRIDTPKGLARIAGGTVAIAGVAWAQTRGIERVEVQIDDGNWLEARLAAEQNTDTWRQWMLAWDAAPGRHEIRVRATETGGAIQTDVRSEPFPSGATGRHQIVVIVE